LFNEATTKASTRTALAHPLHYSDFYFSFQKTFLFYIVNEILSQKRYFLNSRKQESDTFKFGFLIKEFELAKKHFI